MSPLIPFYPHWLWVLQGMSALGVWICSLYLEYFFLDVSLFLPWSLSQGWSLKTQESDYLGENSGSAIVCYYSTWSDDIPSFVSIIFKTKIVIVTALSAALRIKLVKVCKDLESCLNYHKYCKALIAITTTSFPQLTFFLSIIYHYIMFYVLCLLLSAFYCMGRTFSLF